MAGYAAWLVATYVAKQYIDPALQPIVIAATGIIAGAIGGIIVCLIVFIPLHDKPAFTSRGMIATLAISLIGSQLFLMIFGPTAKSLPSSITFTTRPLRVHTSSRAWNNSFQNRNSELSMGVFLSESRWYHGFEEGGEGGSGVDVSICEPTAAAAVPPIAEAIWFLVVWLGEVGRWGKGKDDGRDKCTAVRRKESWGCLPYIST